MQITSMKPDNFEPKIVNRDADYVYAEYQSPTFGKLRNELSHAC